MKRVKTYFWRYEKFFFNNEIPRFARNRPAAAAFSTPFFYLRRAVIPIAYKKTFFKQTEMTLYYDNWLSAKIVENQSVL
jgi:hypothetical protein